MALQLGWVGLVPVVETLHAHDFGGIADSRHVERHDDGGASGIDCLLPHLTVVPGILADDAPALSIAPPRSSCCVSPRPIAPETDHLAAHPARAPPTT
ncbi:MAG: hypothetical protein MJB57_12160 [Gemmatimonadetes bacterium]|nr:hypothetical protein [Gemmatimonadota bacterium]